MSMLLIEIFDKSYYFGFNELTFLKFLAICLLIIVLLIIKRLFSNTPIKFPNIDGNSDFSNYTLGFDENNDVDVSNFETKKVSFLTKLVIYTIALFLVVFPIYYFIQTIEYPPFL